MNGIDLQRWLAKEEVCVVEDGTAFNEKEKREREE